jgi:hypothetical protein
VRSLGERERLDEGLLHLYVAHGLLRTSWEERAGTRFTVDCGAPRLEVAIDGEHAHVAAPLELSLEHCALRVLLPPE